MRLARRTTRAGATTPTATATLAAVAVATILLAGGAPAAVAAAAAGATDVPLSAGQQDWAFGGCMWQCKSDSCRAPASVPLWLRVFFWSCEDNCAYGCMHSVNRDRAAKQPPLPPYKFFNRWPMRRLLGVEEPAAAALSLAAVGVNVFGLAWLRREVAARYHLRGFVIGYSLLAAAAALWSALMHTRRVFWLDTIHYYAATLALLVSAFIALMRLFSNAHNRARDQSVVAGGAFLLAVMQVIYVLLQSEEARHFEGERSHLSRLFRLDVSIVVLHFIAWSALAHRIPDRSYAWQCTALAVCRALEVLIEVEVDVAPWSGVLDVRCACLALSLVATTLWYAMVVRDSHEEYRRQVKSQQHGEIGASAAAAAAAGHGDVGDQTSAAAFPAHIMSAVRQSVAVTDRANATGFTAHTAQRASSFQQRRAPVQSASSHPYAAVPYRPAADDIPAGTPSDRNGSTTSGSRGAAPAGPDVAKVSGFLNKLDEMDI